MTEQSRSDVLKTKIRDLDKEGRVAYLEVLRLLKAGVQDNAVLSLKKAALDRTAFRLHRYGHIYAHDLSVTTGLTPDYQMLASLAGSCTMVDAIVEDLLPKPTPEEVAEWPLDVRETLAIPYAAIPGAFSEEEQKQITDEINNEFPALNASTDALDQEVVPIPDLEEGDLALEEAVVTAEEAERKANEDDGEVTPVSPTDDEDDDFDVPGDDEN